MKIVIFESDPVHVNAAIVTLEEIFQGSIFWHISSESNFLSQLNSADFLGSDIFILDLKCRWRRPGDNSPDEPEDVIMGGALNAGFRIHKLIREQRPDVPIIFWSTLVGNPNVDLRPYLADPNTRAVPKFRGNLIPAIKSLLGVKK